MENKMTGNIYELLPPVIYCCQIAAL